MRVGRNTPSCIGRGDYDTFEIRRERRCNRGEPFRRADAVVGETQAHQWDAGLVACLSAREIVVAHGHRGARGGGYAERQRGLARDRREREGIGQRRNGKIAGKTQTDDANPLSAVFGENFAPIGAEPIDDRASAALGEEAELAADAESGQEQNRVPFTRSPKKRGKCTVNPASAMVRARPMNCGVIPGSSCIRSTSGPAPLR